MTARSGRGPRRAHAARIVTARSGRGPHLAAERPPRRSGPGPHRRVDGLAARVVVLVAVLTVLGAATVWASTRSHRDPTSAPGAPTPAQTATGHAPTGPAATAATTGTASTVAPVTWTSRTVTLDYGGRARSYLLVTPGRATGPLPVIVDLSGSAVSAAYEAGRMDWQAVTSGAVLVFPSDIGETWDAGHCCGTAAASGVDDIGFVQAVTARVLATVATADPSRVYLAGYSNGGKLALDLSCRDPARWRAVAVYGATDTAPCAHRPALSLQVSASSGDPELTIGPTGAPHMIDGFVEPTVAEEVASARAAAACAGTGSAATSGALTTTTWSCPDGRRVALALYQGGSHSWPERSGATPGETEAMWRWFAAAGA